MCCLKNEEEAYEELNSRLPHIGSHVKTAEGLDAEVQSVSVLKQLVKVIVFLDDGEKEVREYRVDELKFRPNKSKNRIKDKHDKELKKLEAMEAKETEIINDQEYEKAGPVVYSSRAVMEFKAKTEECFRPID